MNSDTNEITTNEITDVTPSVEVQNKYTLKILFGPMFGCELHLPADDYFLIINPGPAIQGASVATTPGNEHAASYTQNTLYIPCDTPSPNVLLFLSSPAEEEDAPNGYRIDVHDEIKSYSSLVHENDIFTHEHIRFAIKLSEYEWPESIKNFTLTSTENAEDNNVEPLVEFHNKKKRALIASTIVLVILFLVAVTIWYKKMEDEKRVLTLNEALAGAPVPLEIVRSRDTKEIYVLATQYQAMQWAQKALFKLRENNNVVPVWLTQQKKEIITQLIKKGYPVLQIDYADPQHPVIALWQNLSPQQLENFRSAALQKIPFALDIRTIVKTKPQLLQDARQGLDRLHIYYRQIATPVGYAMVVRDALSDSTLTALKHFIKDFNQQWGNYVINFSINLDENWLQNKSYLDAPNGYLFLNPRHWYFPLKHGDKHG